MSAPAYQNTLISLLLHDVTDNAAESGFQQPTAQRYKHSTPLFRAYLDAVDASGLPVVSAIEADNVRQAAVQFTFDDGGSGALTAAEMLEDRGWRGVFFVTTDLIGRPGFLTAAQINDLNHRGHVIGSHSCSHPDVFRDLTVSQMEYEWNHSRRVLQDLLGSDVTAASIPGGDISADAIRQAAAAGYTSVYTSEQTTQPWQQAGVQCFGRMAMVQTTSPQTLSRWLKYPRAGVLPEQLTRLTKTGVKRMIGPAYRNLMQRRRALHDQQQQQ